MTGAPANRGTALVIDDDPEQRELLAILLSRAGFLFVGASNGAQALGIMHEILPVLIITDIYMPVMDGFEFDSARRKHPALALLPTIVLTASTLEADEVSSRVRADAWLQKPVVPALLMDTIERVLGERAAPRAAGTSLRLDRKKA